MTAKVKKRKRKLREVQVLIIKWKKGGHLVEGVYTSYSLADKAMVRYQETSLSAPDVLYSITHHKICSRLQ